MENIHSWELTYLAFHACILLHIFGIPSEELIYIYLTLGEGTSSSNISNIPWVGMRMKQAPDKPEVWRPFSCLPGYLQETGGKVMEGDVKKFQCRQLLLCLFYTPLYTIINPLIMVYTYHEWFIRVVLCVIYILCIGILNIYVLRNIYIG